MLVLTQVSSRNTKRSGSNPTCCRARNSARAAATSGRCCSGATSVFFERDLPRPEGVPECADAHLEAEFRPQPFQGQVGLLGDGRPQFGLVTPVKWFLLDPRRPGGDLAAGLVAADELPHPLGAGGVLA